MDISKIILQLRQCCPILKSVAGAAEFAAAETQANLPLPAAFVIPITDSAGEQESATGYFQEITESFVVAVCMDNRIDPRGQATSTLQVEDIRAALWQALINWRLDPMRSPRGVAYKDAQLLDNDRARLWYQFGFENVILIDESYGYQPQSVPLTAVELDSEYDPIIATIPQS